jgi:hypothetical protein
VKVDDLPTPGSLVQSVYILDEEELAPAIGFSAGQGVMRIVGLGPSESSPSDHASRPIPLARLFLGNERLEADRLCPLPVAVAVSIIGYAGVGAASCARQDVQALMVFDEGLEFVVFHLGRHLIRSCAILAYYVVPLLAPSDSNYVRSNSEQLFCVTMRDQRTIGG